ncbi:MAG: hypothetical protein WCV80_01985 [Candidatus Paceibacterota bacterium]|jgi:hypothetical protein
MKKTIGFFIGFIMLLGAFSPVFAEMEEIATTTTATSTPFTKWDIIRLMQRGKFAPDTTYEASFSEQELNDFFESELVSLKMKWFVEKASIKIMEDSVEVTARVLRPIKGNMVVRGAVEVRDGEARLKVLSAKYGYFPVPTSFVERTGNFIMKRKSLNEWLTIGNGIWDELKLNDGSLDIKIRAPSQNSV